MARLIDGLKGHEGLWQRLQDLRHLERLPHAMAFTGPSGVGKRLMAWALAQALLCERREQAPCGLCGACRRVSSRQSEGVLAIEPGAVGAPIKIEAAYQVLEFLSLSRLSLARIVIVNEAQALNLQAANSLLKVVEEPPPATHFIFVVPEISQLLPTLRSRCQVLRFAPLSDVDLQQDGVVTEPWVLRSARGSFERLEMFKSEDSGRPREMAFEFLTGAIEGDPQVLQQTVEKSRDRETVLELIRFLQQALRDWVVLDTDAVLHADRRSDLKALPAFDPAQKVELWRKALQMEHDVLSNVDRGLVIENFFYQARR